MKKKDISKQIEELKEQIEYVSCQMQELREAIRGAPFSIEMLPMPKPYVHPWWQHQWTGSVPSRNNLGGYITTTEYNSDKAGFGVSGTTKAA